MMLLLVTSFTVAHALVLPAVPDLIAVAQHLPDVFHSNFSAFTFQDLMTAVEQLPGAVANVRMPFAESPELLPTVHQIDAMDQKDSSERTRYFSSLFILTYLATVLLGTCIMTVGPRCGCCGTNGSSRGWQAMATIVAKTCDVEDGTSSEDTKSSGDDPVAEVKADWEIIQEDSNSLEDSSAAAQADTRPEWKIREDETRQVQQRWLVTVVFSAVVCASLTAAIFSLTTDRLSKKTGLDWEVYYLLFGLNCTWLLGQAVVAAARAARRASNFAITAFFEGTISGTWPVISDSYDTLKDVLVGALCLHSDSMFLQVLGVISWLYLAAIHASFIGDDLCLSELLSSYAPILVMPTALNNRADGPDPEDSSCCRCCLMFSKLHNFLKGLRETLIVQAYRQVTPVKRYLLGVENIFQGIVGIAYMVMEGGSIFVALLNVVIPIIQIFLTFLLHKPLRRQAAPWFAKRLKLALENGDVLTEEQIKEEVYEDVGIFAAVAPHLADYNSFTELELRFISHGIDDAGAVELAAALEQLQQLTTLRLGLDDNSIGDAGAVAMAEAVRCLPRLERVVVGLSFNRLGDEGRAAWRRLEEELQSRSCGVDIHGVDIWLDDTFDYIMAGWIGIFDD